MHVFANTTPKLYPCVAGCILLLIAIYATALNAKFVTCCCVESSGSPSARAHGQDDMLMTDVGTQRG